MRTQVAIVGAGPAGLLLAELLRSEGVDSVVLERRSRAYVESRIRAGVLEQTTVALMERVGADARLKREGLPHAGVLLSRDGEPFRIDFQARVGGSVVVYGQTELTHDLIAQRLAAGAPLRFEAADVAITDLDGDRPVVTWRDDGGEHRLTCDFVAGCDGSHGVCRTAMPEDFTRDYSRAYPFGWLGILADVAPCNEELIYSSHERGFALASMRSQTRSRYYVQVARDERLEDWPDERLWDELALRLGPEAAAHMTRGPAIEKSIAPLASHVMEPMRYARLFLAGDAAHIVPPTGAKGLNLAASDVGYLAEALVAHYRTGSTEALDGYSARALARVWKAERFSWWFTTLMHRFPDADGFSRKLQVAELDYLRRSEAAQTAFAENYVGLKLD